MFDCTVLNEQPAVIISTTSAEALKAATAAVHLLLLQSTVTSAHFKGENEMEIAIHNVLREQRKVSQWFYSLAAFIAT